MLHWEIMGLRAAIALLMLIGVAVVALLGYEVATPTDALQAGPVLVEIPAHDGVLEIAQPSAAGRWDSKPRGLRRSWRAPGHHPAFEGG